MMADNSTHMDLALCRECGGRCCQGSPGIWVDPERFFARFFSGRRLALQPLREALPALGLVLWENSGVPMPAPRSELSGCGFHGREGCALSPAERPCQCLALEPRRQTLEQPQGCHCHLPAAFSREVAMGRWRDYWLALGERAAGT